MAGRMDPTRGYGLATSISPWGRWRQAVLHVRYTNSTLFSTSLVLNIRSQNCALGVKSSRNTLYDIRKIARDL